jgi:hypothetical protein
MPCISTRMGLLTKSLSAISYAPASERWRSVLRRTRWPFCVTANLVLTVESRLSNWNDLGDLNDLGDWHDLSN